METDAGKPEAAQPGGGDTDTVAHIRPGVIAACIMAGGLLAASISAGCPRNRRSPHRGHRCTVRFQLRKATPASAEVRTLGLHRRTIDRYLKEPD